jgi:hypothetical protein
MQFNIIRMMRSPAVAGMFYPRGSDMLLEQVKACIVKTARERACGIVVPHAGFVYSGKVAGAVYSSIEMPDTFVILGPNHTGAGSNFSIETSGSWRTPLGDVAVDEELALGILKNSKNIEVDETAHKSEHSIEVQLPFMQYFSKSFRIVPIVVKHYTPDEYFLKACIEVGDAIAHAIGAGRRVVVVASTDFSHYESQETAEKNDKLAIDAILSLDAKRLFREVGERDISMCGYGPVAAAITSCVKLGCTKARLVKYMTSGDVSGDYGRVVGYGGVSVVR